MELHYYQDSRGNFGDDLNEWIWDVLLPRWRSWDPETTLLGVGTLIHDVTARSLSGRRVLVLGAGAGYGATPEASSIEKWDFRAVRGPATAQILGLPLAKAIIDPATMVSDFPEFQNLTKKNKVVFVPQHCTTDRHPWKEICENININYVSPEDDSRYVIQEIAQSPLVLAESMHAAIIADSFRVPWIPISISRRFNPKKWVDFLAGGEIIAPIDPLFPILDRIAQHMDLRRARWAQEKLRISVERPRVAQMLQIALKKPSFLTSDQLLAERKEKYHEILESVRKDYGGHA